MCYLSPPTQAPSFTRQPRCPHRNAGRPYVPFHLVFCTQYGMEGGRIRVGIPRLPVLSLRGPAWAEPEKAELLQRFETAIREALPEADPPKGGKDPPGRGAKMGS